ncbi:MAG TPA: DUF4185 domain-containing protein [Verrucomicrobiae bacterium]
MHALTLSLIFLGIAAKALSAPEYIGTPAPDLDAIFRQTNGWIGADGDYSVQLNKTTTLWLFDDTVIGQIHDGKRIHATMVNNTIAIRHADGSPSFYYPTNSAGKPASVFQPTDDTNSFFWPWDGIRTERGLFVFLMQVRHTTDKSAWGFQVFATALAFVPNPDDPPQDWKITLRRVPYKPFGWAVMRDGDFIYIYGSNKKKGGSLLARAPETALDDFALWRFYSDGQWQSDTNLATPVFPEGPAEGSVRWLPELKRYATIYSPDIFGDIVMRTAEAPEGPWTNRQVVFHCPDGKRSRAYFCYAAKMHPEMSNPGEIIITYAVNSNNFSDLFSDPELYWPRFVRVKIP